MARVCGGRLRTVTESGARAGSILCGCGPHNLGFRLRILLDQPKGQDGPVQGSFEILAAGVGMHAQSLGGLMHRLTDAAEVLRAVRQGHAGNGSVADANILTLEQPQPEGEPGAACDPDQYSPKVPPAQDSAHDEGPDLRPAPSSPPLATADYSMNGHLVHVLPKLERSGKITVLTFTANKRDLSNMLANELAGRADTSEGCHLLLDFTNVTMVSSAELGTLIGLHKRLKASGGRLTLFNLCGPVYEVFEITRLNTVMAICRALV